MSPTFDTLTGPGIVVFAGKIRISTALFCEILTSDLSDIALPVRQSVHIAQQAAVFTAGVILAK